MSDPRHDRLTLPRPLALALGLALGLCVAGRALGQGEGRQSALPATPQQEKPDPAAEPLWHVFSDEVALADLLDFCAGERGLGIAFERDRVSGGVHVQQTVGMRPEEIWRLLHRELALRGFTTVQAPGSDTLSVVPIGDAAALARVEPLGFGSGQAGFIRVLFPLSHRTSAELIEAVRLVLSKPGGNAQELRGANAIVVSDLYWHVEQALWLIRELDQAQSPPVVREIALDRAHAVTLAGTLERIVQAQKQVAEGSELGGKLSALPETNSLLLVAPADEVEAWEALVGRFDRAEGVVTEHYQPRRFGLAETAQLIERVVHPADSTERAGAWRLIEDGLTGTLILTTTPSRHREVHALLARLESTAAGARRPMRSFSVKNRQVAEVLEVLRQLLDAGAIELPEAPALEAAEDAQGVTGSLPPPRVLSRVRVGEGERGVVLTADEPTNRLIAVGEAALLDQLGPLIETIDVRGEQVLVEATVVTLNESDTRALGVELRKIGVSDGVLYELSSLFGLGAAEAGGIGLPATTAAGGTAAVLDPGSFSAVVRALQTVNHGRSLDMPKLLVNNNQQARLDSVVEAPYLLVTANNTIATTAYGGSLDAGTTITVKPQVARGDHLVLDYSVSVSAFVAPPADPALPPPRQQSLLDSVVTVPDGYTVVVGGLELQTKTEGATQVPVLGDIPVLGALFRSTTTTQTRDRFFVFLRCTVMRASEFEDLRFATAQMLPGVGIGEEWPRIRPRVMR